MRMLPAPYPRSDLKVLRHCDGQPVQGTLLLQPLFEDRDVTTMAVKLTAVGTNRIRALEGITLIAV